MTVMQVQEIPDVTVRGFRAGDENVFFELLKDSFASLEYLPRVKAEINGPYFDREGSFIAERNGSAIGCVGLRNLPREKWHEIRYLAVKNGEPKVRLAQNLIAKAVHYADSNRAEHLTAFAPAVQPYIDVYKSAGFVPVRRSLRIGWEITEHHTQQSNVQTRELSKDFANEAADVWIEGLRPYWDYWIEEQGGPEKIKSWVKESVGTEPGWAFDSREQEGRGRARLFLEFGGEGFDTDMLAVLSQLAAGPAARDAGRAPR